MSAATGASEEAGVASRHIYALLSASITSCGRSPPAGILEFVAETVAGYVEEGDPLTKDDALSLFMDAELDLDDDDCDDLAATVEILTGGGGDQAAGDGGDEEREVDDGTCELCERLVKRTFHHLVPKVVSGHHSGTFELAIKTMRLESAPLSFFAAPSRLKTHKKYLNRQRLPDNLAAVGGELSRVWLGTHGALLCRPCHNAVHGAASNAELAESYNTVRVPHHIKARRKLGTCGAPRVSAKVSIASTLARGPSRWICF